MLAVQCGCKDNSGIWDDARPPLVSVTVEDPSIATDQDLHFVVQASDDVSLRTIRWSVTGPVVKDTLIEFTVTTPRFHQLFTVTDDLTPGLLLIVAMATDGSGNEAIPDSTLVLVVTN